MWSRRARWTVAVAILALGSARLGGQGFSFQAPFPTIVKHAATGLQVDYSAGKIAVGGLIQSIVAGNVTVTDAMTSCQAPTFSACNFLYWPGTGTALSTSTAFSTAYASGNVVLAFVTTTGGNVTLVTPAPVNPPPTTQQGAYSVTAQQCVSLVSGNATGTNGQTTTGASNIGVVQAQTSGTGTNTHSYQCNITPPVRPSAILDVTFFYGTIPGLGTQAAVLGSGTMNGSIVFSSISFPAPGASETPSTVTPVRADSGSLTILPVVASFNTTTTTAGSFYSVLFTPATPIAVGPTTIEVLLTVTLQNAATTATITNSPGAVVRYTR